MMDGGIASRQPLDPEACRVSCLAMGAAALASALGWTVAGAAAFVFGLLTLWLATQFAAAPPEANEELRDG